MLRAKAHSIMVSLIVVLYAGGNDYLVERGSGSSQNFPYFPNAHGWAIVAIVHQVHACGSSWKRPVHHPQEAYLAAPTSEKMP